MLSILNQGPPPRDFGIADLCIDVVLSGCPAILGFAAFGMAWSGFKYFYAGMTLVALTHFALGVLRGTSSGNIVIKSLCISMASLILASVLGRPFTIFFFPATIPAAGAGLWLRRRLLQKKEEGS